MNRRDFTALLSLALAGCVLPAGGSSESLDGETLPLDLVFSDLEPVLSSTAGFSDAQEIR